VHKIYSILTLQRYGSGDERRNDVLENELGKHMQTEGKKLKEM